MCTWETPRPCTCMKVQSNSVAHTVTSWWKGDERRVAMAMARLRAWNAAADAKRAGRDVRKGRRKRRDGAVVRSSFRYRAGRSGSGDGEEDVEEENIVLASELFNRGEFYRCHDVLEEMWHDAVEPQRTGLQGLVQCAVALHHLLDGNHRGGMLELGEGLRKLKRLQLEAESWTGFVEGMEDVLDFVYDTQMEFAACEESSCSTMDGSQESYDLMGDFGSGELLYKAVKEDEKWVLEFESEFVKKTKVQVPTLMISEEELQSM